MRSGIVLAIAIALFTAHGPGIAKESVTAGAGSKTKKTTKKTATKKKPATRKSSVKKPHPIEPIEDAAAIAASTDLYKKELAQKISDANPTQVYTVQPQALLRSVVVVRFIIDKNGKLVSSVVHRSNGDPVTEAAALASLRSVAPLPKPPAKLLSKSRIDLLETWLFNDDGRFQIRSIAQLQKSE